MAPLISLAGSMQQITAKFMGQGYALNYINTFLLGNPSSLIYFIFTFPFGFLINTFSLFFDPPLDVHE